MKKKKAITEEKTFYECVYEIVRTIPEGRVTSYGAIARVLGTARSSRMVGYALRASQGVYPFIPAHRVVNRIGMLTGKSAFGSATMMQQLLENESIVVEDDRVVNFKNLFWEPENGE